MNKPGDGFHFRNELADERDEGGKEVDRPLTERGKLWVGILRGESKPRASNFYAAFVARRF